MSWIVSATSSLLFSAKMDEYGEGPTGHLSPDRLRALLTELLDAGKFKAKDVYAGTDVKSSPFSKWKTGVSRSKGTEKVVREYLNRYFADKDLPAGYKKGAPDKTKEKTDDNNDDEDDDGDDAATETPPGPETQPQRASAPDAEKYTQIAPSGEKVQRIRMCSWNVLGWSSNTTDKKKANIYQIVDSFDVVALQEVRTDIAAQRRDNSLSTRLSEYALAQSPELHKPDSRHKERILYFYKSKDFDLVDARVLQADMDRQPYLLTLRQKTTGYLFSLISVHIVYGGSDLGPRRQEVAQVIAVVAACAKEPEVYGEVFLCGDFNLEPTDWSFWPLRSELCYYMSNEKVATTVGQKNNVYDTFWFPIASRVIRPDLSTVITFQGIYDNRDVESRKTQKKDRSDHLPVAISLDVRY